MTSIDEDVAAILGLPSAGFSSGSRATSRQRSRRRLVAGLVVGVAVLAASAGGIALRARWSMPPVAYLARLPPSSRAANTSGGVAPARPPAPDVPFVSHGVVLAVAAAPPPSGSTPSPPPPPKAHPFEQMKSPEPFPSSAIVPPPSERLSSIHRDAPMPVRPPAVVELDTPSDANSSAWLAEPTGEDVARAYPEAALRAGAPGSAVMSCIERTDGTVRDCRVLDEQPFGAGFGRAAVRLSRRFRFTPIIIDGRAVEAEVTIPYDFSVVD